MPEIWIRCWYEVAKTLPSAARCTARLVVAKAPAEEDESTVFGSYHPQKDEITVCLLPNPYEALATLLHEMAHATCNQRHRRHHGYSWRREFGRLVHELVGVDPLPVARDLRDYGTDQGRIGSRQAALDWATIYLITDQRPPIYRSGGRVHAVVGGREIVCPAPRLVSG